MPRFFSKPPHRLQRLLLVALLAAVAIPAFSYTVYLKDGSKLASDGPPVIKNGKAIITLQSGMRTSISADEIDLERTRAENKDDYGSAVVLGGAGATREVTVPVPDERSDRVSDLIARGAVTRRERPQSRREHVLDPTDLQNWQRVPYHDNLDLVSEIQGVFRGQGFESVGVYRGTQPRRLLIEIETNSESAVFRGLKVAAGALNRAVGLHPRDIEALEVVLATASNERAGEFVVTAADAAELLAEGAEVSTFFVKSVRF
ncbi:MAG: hypothetical protein OES47_07500 [Acidobacteriota bacterium]|nr:hypothetical protein [Acidobacteriota bacterium]